MRGLRGIAISFMLAAALSAWAEDPAPAAPAPAPAAPAPAQPAAAAAAPAPAAAAAPPAAPALTDIRQVQINVLIGEFGEQGLRDIGVNLNYTRFVNGKEQKGSVERISTNVFDPQNPGLTVTLPAPDTNPFPDNLRPDQAGTLADGVQTQSGAGMTFNIIDGGRGTIEGIARGNEQKTDLDLYSKPELLVIDKQPATIHAGGDVPYQSIQYDNAGRPILNVAWQPTGVKMDLTPTIRTDDLIQIDLTGLEVTELSRIENVRGLDLPVFSTRKQNGSVLVPNNKSLVIGGLSSRNVRKVERRVPILGKLPILGIPFRGRQNQASTTTLFIFLTPTVVDLRNMQPPAENALDFWKNGEWHNQERIQKEVDAMSQDL